MSAFVKDHAIRKQALDVTKSFIVQAPAGSGKTQLLTQRFLALLANVTHSPEEIVAITFTRKAATEMRARIFDALRNASQQEPPTEEHSLQTWQLAQKVLERDHTAAWHLLENPNRLRILTIDALCAKIAKSAPLVSHFGTVPEVIDDAHPLYLEAARLLLYSLDESAPWTQSLVNLLSHLDSNYSAVENLFVGMLKRRDQWLPYIVGYSNWEEPRERLEEGLQNCIIQAIKGCESFFTPSQKKELLTLMQFAASILKDAQENSTIASCFGISTFPACRLDHYTQWQAIAELLLTKSLEWRRAVNKKSGFPAAKDAMNAEEEILFKSMKERMQKLLAQFSQNDGLLKALQAISLCPPQHYSEKQWEIIKALIELLPVLVAYLNVVFKQRTVVDFIAITQGAIYALGETDNPSELALNLDYRIAHLLIDEFQDTSATQYRLLELLIAGWEVHDGRTLFLVGDPMQSIYRFREAEVGIFLKVRNHGIGNLQLQPLTLEVNFRSVSGIIHWINTTFAAIFPRYENVEYGAITFSQSFAFHSSAENLEHVTVHAFNNPHELAEAKKIVDVIQIERTRDQDASIAILVRSRSHLHFIIPELKKAQLEFQAVEIDKLIHSTAVEDLFALTRALLHLGDRVAWLAILRAPWCGLSLADLHIIANVSAQATLWETVQNYEKLLELSSHAKRCLNRIVPILQAALSNRGRSTLRKWLSQTWYLLGGPACFEEEYEIQNAQGYLRILDQMEKQNNSIDFHLLESKIATAYTTSSSTANAKIQVMTIHKAKGLEFDVVILPSLEKRPAIDESRLLLWLEKQNPMGNNDLILAPIKSLEEDFDPIYRYLRNHETQKSRHEIVRLLYVAITRAKKSLHLVGSIFQESQDADDLRPETGSLLEILWPSVSQNFTIKHVPINESETKIHDPHSHRFERLLNEWQSPISFPFDYEKPTVTPHNQFSWSAHYLHYVGTLLHATLQKMTSASWKINDLQREKLHWHNILLQRGVDSSTLKHCLLLIEKAVNRTLNDPRGQWLLSNHPQAQSEYPITFYDNEEIVHLIIDRTFVDEEGYRWIVDYKSSEITDEDPASFLPKAKVRYHQQLTTYAKAFAKLENRPIKLGLYFPLFSGWYAWDFVTGEEKCLMN